MRTEDEGLNVDTPSDTTRVLDQTGAPDQPGVLEQRNRELQQHVAILRSTLNAAADGILVADDNGDVLYCNDNYLRLLRLDRAAVEGRRHAEVLKAVSQQFEDPRAFLAGVDAVYDSPDQTSFDVLRTSDGRVYERHSTAQRIDGRLFGRIWSFRDISELHDLNDSLEQRVTERTAALLRSERQFQQLVNGVRDCAIYMLDRNGHVISWNPGAERIKGYTAQEIIGRHFSVFYTEEDRAHDMPEHSLSIAATEGKYEREAWRIRKDGTRFWASILIDAIHGPEGELVGFAKITRDMTERRAMQEQLHQSQKMEAVGQLTGGVAHDFNNLLTVILGNLETIDRHAPADERLRRAIDQASRGAQRAATLTQQLLAFARRQPLDPKPSDVNELVVGMSDLICRTLGEDVSIETQLSEELWRVEVDPHQLESAILNLAVNSRDAMRAGGKLTLQTRNVVIEPGTNLTYADLAPGEYIRIAVIDTGTGMSSDVLAHAFDPFFTTKPIGEGTGLGLSQVFGFVKQSGGHVKLASEVGQGTTVSIYLPRLVGEVVRADDEAPAAAPMRGHLEETILVVEDDEDVRIYSTESLSELGFTVLEAADGESALRILDRHPEVVLMFTDVGLPRINGRQLVDAARSKRPELKVLFTSGYARQAIVHEGRLDQGIDLLTKPFTRAQLAARIRAVLDRSASAPAQQRIAVVIDDEVLIGMYLADVLQDIGFTVIQSQSAQGGLEAVERAPESSVAFVDIGLPDRSGLELAAEMRARFPHLKIAIASGLSPPSIDLREDAHVAFLSKPFDAAAIKRALQTLQVA
jgi:PAS domain S-box-containing protein